MHQQQTTGIALYHRRKVAEDYFSHEDNRYSSIY